MELTLEQKKAKEELLTFLNTNINEYLLEGAGGSGKTTLISYLFNKLLKKDTNIDLHVLAFTNNAVKILKQKFCSNNENIYFNTIHKFFNSKYDIDKYGNSYFKKMEYKNSLLFKNSYEKDKKYIIIVDECSLVNYNMYKLFNNMLKKYNNIKLLYLGDRKQISYIEDNTNIITNIKIISLYFENKIKTNFNIKEYLYKFLIYKNSNNISPTFYIKNKFFLKGNVRINNNSLQKINDYTRISVDNNINQFNFNNFINTDIIKINKYDLDFLIINKNFFNGNNMILCYYNDYRHKLNNSIRDKLFYNKPYYNEYNFLANEIIKIRQQFAIEFGSTYKFFNTNDIYKIDNTIIQPNYKISFFSTDIFFKCNIQHIIFQNDIMPVLKQVELIDLNNFIKFIDILKNTTTDYTYYRDSRYDNKYLKYKNIKDRCFICKIKKIYFRILKNKEKICKKCHKKIFLIIDKIVVNSMNYENNYKKAIKKIYNHIQNLSLTYNPPLDHTYVMTSTKSQGSTFDEVVLCIDDINKLQLKNPKEYNRHIYVSISRTRNKLYILTD